MKFFKPFPTPTVPTFPDYYVNIRDFGAADGGEKQCTDAIRKAIDACSKNGGGHVIIPSGEWLTAAIHLKDNVDLHLDKGALVRFSTKFEDYLPVVYGILGGVRVYSVSHFIYAYRCRNIAVTGDGIFDGQGEAWWYMKKHQPGMKDLLCAGKEGRPVEERVYDKAEDGVRPHFLQFAECENVLIEGVTFRNSPSWNVHPAWCRNITIRGVKVYAPMGAPNTDGIDLESCRRALVENCTVEAGDDCFCLKAGRDEDAWQVGVPCEDVEIRGCHGKGGFGSFVIGSETSAGIRNIYLHDSTFSNMWSGVRMKTMQGRGGVIENIDFENIKVEKAQRWGISVTMRYDGEPLDNHGAALVNMPTVRNLSVENFTCTDANVGIEILGVPNAEPENICLSDVEIHASDPLHIENAGSVKMKNVSIDHIRTGEN